MSDDTKQLLNIIHEKVSNTQIDVADIKARIVNVEKSQEKHDTKIECLERLSDKTNGALKAMKYLLGLVVAGVGVLIGIFR